MAGLRAIMGLMLLVAVAAGVPVAETRAQSCSFSMTDVDFGNIDLTAGGAFTTTATLNVTCTGLPNRIIILCPNIGAGSGGVAASGDPRRMLNGVNQLDYNLYWEVGLTTVWGSYLWPYPPRPPQFGVFLNGAGTASGFATVYARVNAGQSTLPGGLYTSSFAGAHTAFQYQYFNFRFCNNLNAPITVQVPFTARAFNVGSCSVSATNLDFGNTGVLNANVDTTNSITVLCPAATPYTVAINGGLSGAADPTQRKMVKGSEQITYGIYRDAARTLPWGDTVGVNTLASTGTGANQVFTGYGRVPAQSTPSPGTYSDTLVVTVTW